MNQNIDTIKKTRGYVLQLLADATVEQLNDVPAGFNNNIIWNLGHMVAAQQGVCYLRAGLKTHISETFYRRFKPDTKSEGFINADEVETIKGLLLSTLDGFEADYGSHLFSKYPSWTTRYGATLSTIDEAVQFLLFHEGLHTGYIMAQKRLVKR